MQTLYNGPDDTQITLLTSPEEVEDFIALLERIAAELLWQPGDQIRAQAGMAVHITGKLGNRGLGRNGTENRVKQPNEIAKYRRANLHCSCHFWPLVLYSFF